MITEKTNPFDYVIDEFFMYFGVGSTYWELTDATPLKKNIDLKKGSIYIVSCSTFDLCNAITLCVLLIVYLSKMLTKRSKYYLFVAVNFFTHFVN